MRGENWWRHPVWAWVTPGLSLFVHSPAVDFFIFSHPQQVGSYCDGGSWPIYRYSRKLLRVFLLLLSFWSTVIFVFLLGLSNLRFMATLAMLGLKFCLTIHWCLQTGHHCSLLVFTFLLWYPVPYQERWIL